MVRNLARSLHRAESKFLCVRLGAGQRRSYVQASGRDILTLSDLLSRVSRHRLARNTGALMIVQIVSYVAPLLVLVYLARTLGMQIYGVVAFAFSIVQIAAVFLDFGFTLSATQRISRHRNNVNFINRLIGAAFVFKVLGLVLVAAPILIYAKETQKYAEFQLVIIWSLLAISGLSFQPLWLFAGLERMRYITWLTIISKIAGLILLYVLVKAPSDAHWAVIADGAAQILGTAVALAIMFKVGYRPVWPRWRTLRYVFVLTLPFFLSRLAVTTYISSGVFLLGLFVNPSVAASYAVAERLYQALQQVFAPIVQSMYPYMVKERALKLLFKIASACVGLAVFVCAAGLVWGDVVLGWVSVSAPSSSLGVWHVFCLAIVVHVANVMFGHPLGAALRATSVANTSVMLGALLYGALAWLFIQTGYATAVNFAWIMVGTEVMILTYRLITFSPLIRQALVEQRNRVTPT